MSPEPTLPGEQGEENKPPRQPWYRRRALVVTMGIVVVLAVTVISDLPVHGSAAANISAGRSVMTEVNTDIASCAFGLKESFTIHSEQIAGSLGLLGSREAPSLLRDDLAACSFTDDNIFELSSIEVPGSSAGRRLGDVVNTVTLWATSDAIGAISDVQSLFTHPHAKASLRDLAKREAALAADRAAAFGDITEADKLLGVHLQEPDLPGLPVLPPSATN
jgi:hypothetical protein